MSDDEATRLLLAAAAGDRTALHGFVRLTQTEVWRFCASLVDRGAADDLTQETYVRAMRSVDRFRGDSSARTWLLVIARRVCADEIRVRQRRRRLRDRVALATPVEDAPDHAGEADLHRLLEVLDTDRREAFVLTQVVGLTYRDAAEALGVPVGTVRSRVARARDDLIRALGTD